MLLQFRPLSSVSRAGGTGEHKTTPQSSVTGSSPLRYFKVSMKDKLRPHVQDSGWEAMTDRSGHQL